MSLNPNAIEFVPASNVPSTTSAASAAAMAMAKEYGNTQATANANATELLARGAKGAAMASTLNTLLLGGVAGFASGIPSAFASVYNNTQNIAFQSKYLDKEWQAAASIGLASPSQFGTLGAGMAVKRYAGAVNAVRSPSGSVYSV